MKIIYSILTLSAFFMFFLIAFILFKGDDFEKKAEKNLVIEVAKENDKDADNIVDRWDSMPEIKALGKQGVKEISRDPFILLISREVLQGRDTFNIVGNFKNINKEKITIILDDGDNVYNTKPLQEGSIDFDMGVREDNFLLIRSPTGKEFKIGIAINNKIEWFNGKLKDNRP